jgi:hypothetical protein
MAPVSPSAKVTLSQVELPPMLVLPCHWQFRVKVAPLGSVPIFGDPVPGPDRTFTDVVVR